MIWLPSDEVVFPDYTEIDSNGIIAIGGNLLPETLIQAYKKGIFPWFNEDEPIIWHCPNPRFVLFPEKLKISKSMEKIIKSNLFNVTYNQNFLEVILHCRRIPRKGQNGTWITNEMVEAFYRLHQLGIAKSIEVWQNNDIVGGFYGVDIGNGIFSGESMFSKVSNASKFGFIQFVKNYGNNYKLIDCQTHTTHLESFGAEKISRAAFIKHISEN